MAIKLNMRYIVYVFIFLGFIMFLNQILNYGIYDEGDDINSLIIAMFLFTIGWITILYTNLRKEIIDNFNEIIEVQDFLYSQQNKK